MKEIIKQYKWFLVGLFVFSFLIRAAVFIGYLSKNKNYFQVDSNTYHLIATQISEGNGFCNEKGTSNFYRLPGYPVFLSIYYKIFGPDTQNVLWLQILLAALIPISVFLLSFALFPQNILLAKCAGIYSSIHLGLVLYSGFFMSETLFIFLFLIFAILFLSCVHLFFCKEKKRKSNTSPKLCRYLCLPEPIATSEPYLLLFEDIFESEQKEILRCLYGRPDEIKISRNIFFAGLALGLASLVRPVGHYLIILSLLLIIFSRDDLRQKINLGLTLTLGWLIPVSFWLLRNFLLTGCIFFHTLPGGHFLYFSASRIAMHEYNCSYEQAKDILRNQVDSLITKEEQNKKRSLSEIEQCYVREDLAKQYFKNYPSIAFKLWLTDIFRTTFSLFSSEILYLETDRAEFDYFDKDRTVSSMFSRYIFPKTDKPWLSWLIRLEIFIFLLLWIGLFLGFLRIFTACIKNWSSSINRAVLCSWARSLVFIKFFIIIGLAGGYARMRLPAEPFLIILSLSFWTYFLSFDKLRMNGFARFIQNNFGS
jgi:hypothetical protein